MKILKKIFFKNLSNNDLANYTKISNIITNFDRKVLSEVTNLINNTENYILDNYELLEDRGINKDLI